MRGSGVKVAFVTNNSYRPPGQVVEKLNRLGVKATEGEVLTSAQAVRLLGGRAGLRGVRSWWSAGPGCGRRSREPGRGWSRVQPGARPRWWRSVRPRADLRQGPRRHPGHPRRGQVRRQQPGHHPPDPRGLWPGAGATLALLRASTGVRPEVAGKPERALLDTAAAAIGPGPYLMVGDRADTDLDGAHRLGWSTALVLSGVTSVADLPDLANPPDHVLPDAPGPTGSGGPPSDCGG